MSRAGAAASRARRQAERELAELDAWAARIEAGRLADSTLVRCEACGLEQVDDHAGVPVEFVVYGGRPCVMCGCLTGTYAGPTI